MRFLNILSSKECEEFIEYFESQSNHKDVQVKGSNILYNSKKGGVM